MDRTASPRPRVRTESLLPRRASIRHHGGVSVDEERHWTLLTNHGRILLLIAQDPDLRIRDLAEAAGVTERTAQTIVTDLESAGYIQRSREGRRNVYTVNRRRPFRHPAESGHRVGELIDLFAPTS
jgi:DNA-binding MarR family transcriptional regulator